MYNIPDKLTVYDPYPQRTGYFHLLVNEESVTKRKQSTLAKTHTRGWEFSNIPTPGYMIYAADFSKGKWYISGPNGLRTTISANNLSMLLKNTSILNGVISQLCVWVEIHSSTPSNSLMLIPVSSSMYETAVADTLALRRAPSLSDIQIGDRVTLRNGDSGEYFGTHTFITSCWPIYSRNGTATMSPIVKRKVHAIQTGAGVYFSPKPKFLSRIPASVVGQPLDARQTLVDINTESPGDFHGISVFGKFKYGVLSTYIRQILKPGSYKVSMRLVEISKDQAAQLINESFKRADAGMVMLCKNDLMYILDIGHRVNYATIEEQAGSPFDVLRAEVVGTEFSTIKVWEQSQGFFRPPSLGTVDDFDKFYSIEKTVSNSLTYV